MPGSKQELVMTGVDKHGQQIFQPKNSFYGEEYWEGVAIGSVLIPEEPEITQEVIKLTPEELEVYYFSVSGDDVTVEEEENE